MEYQTAARHLAAQLEPSLKYEWFAVESYAKDTATAMTVITGTTWIVRKGMDAAQWWVVKA